MQKRLAIFGFLVLLLSTIPVFSQQNAQEIQQEESEDYYTKWLNDYGGDPAKIPEAFNSVAPKYQTQMLPQLVSNSNPPAIPPPQPAAGGTGAAGATGPGTS